VPHVRMALAPTPLLVEAGVATLRISDCCGELGAQSGRRRAIACSRTMATAGGLGWSEYGSGGEGAGPPWPWMPLPRSSR
jgi:hypothetical protein